MLISLYIYLITTALFAIIPLTYIQLEGYRPSKHPKYIRYLILDVILTSAVGLGCFFSPYPIICAQVILLSRLLYFLSARRKHFTFTKRGVRLFATTALLQIALGIIFRIFSPSLLFFHYSLLPLFSYITSLLALVLTYPIESYISNGYIKKAKEKLAQIPLRIGITGSAGKTSVKNILKELLSVKYTVATTRENYNTPMGIVKSLSDYNGEEIFIAEMGARRIGDIGALIDIVKPQIGVLTTVNEQHLETFRDVFNIVREKTTLINNATDFSVVNIDNIHLKNLDFDPKVIKIGEGTEVFATSIKSDIKGTIFVANIFGRRIKIVTPLLGARAVDNILIAMAVAYKLGVDIDSMQDALRTIDCTPHRLQKIVTKSGVTILDDGYNSNVDGVLAAIKLIATFKGRKIICAQGIIEQGKKQKEVNTKLGKHLAKVADIIITLSVNAKYIKRGALNAGFSSENLYVCKDLTKATELFSTMVKSGDLVYLQNDIPTT